MKGGIAEKKGFTILDADPVELTVGTEIEMEHTDDKRLAVQIALDHLAEFPNYYRHLVEMEERLKKKLPWVDKDELTYQEKDMSGEISMIPVDMSIIEKDDDGWQDRLGKWVAGTPIAKYLESSPEDPENPFEVGKLRKIAEVGGLAAAAGVFSAAMMLLWQRGRDWNRAKFWEHQQIIDALKKEQDKLVLGMKYRVALDNKFGTDITALKKAEKLTAEQVDQIQATIDDLSDTTEFEKKADAALTYVTTLIGLLERELAIREEDDNNLASRLNVLENLIGVNSRQEALYP